MGSGLMKRGGLLLLLLPLVAGVRLSLQRSEATWCGCAVCPCTCACATCPCPRPEPEPCPTCPPAYRAPEVHERPRVDMVVPELKDRMNCGCSVCPCPRDETRMQLVEKLDCGCSVCPCSTHPELTDHIFCGCSTCPCPASEQMVRPELRDNCGCTQCPCPASEQPFEVRAHVSCGCSVCPCPQHVLPELRDYMPASSMRTPEFRATVHHGGGPELVTSLRDVSTRVPELTDIDVTRRQPDMVDSLKLVGTQVPEVKGGAGAGELPAFGNITPYFSDGAQARAMVQLQNGTRIATAASPNTSTRMSLKPGKMQELDTDGCNCSPKPCVCKAKTEADAVVHFTPGAYHTGPHFVQPRYTTGLKRKEDDRIVTDELLPSSVEGVMIVTGRDKTVHYRDAPIRDSSLSRASLPMTTAQRADKHAEKKLAQTAQLLDALSSLLADSDE